MGKIKCTRVWLGALAGWAIFMIWSGVTNFLVLMPKYAAAQAAEQMLAEPRYPFFMAVWAVTLFAVAVIGAFLYAASRATLGAGPKTALIIGALVGFAAGFPIDFSLSAWATFPRVIPLWWLLELGVGSVLSTLVAGFIYRE
ncbi:MAG: hypothetical protein GW878_01765 [Acidobacteria bacterium]|nr:hypothetical protein [Acidobacteriota bacterium]